jgi:hypothetical protein
MHHDTAFREYMDWDWFQSVTRTKLCQWWTDADIASSDDDNTTYDTQTHEGSHV